MPVLDKRRIVDHLEAECRLHVERDPAFSLCARTLGDLFLRSGDRTARPPRARAVPRAPLRRRSRSAPRLSGTTATAVIWYIFSRWTHEPASPPRQEGLPSDRVLRACSGAVPVSFLVQHLVRPQAERRRDRPVLRRYARSLATRSTRWCRSASGCRSIAMSRAGIPNRAGGDQPESGASPDGGLDDGTGPKLCPVSRSAAATDPRSAADGPPQCGARRSRRSATPRRVRNWSSMLRPPPSRRRSREWLKYRLETRRLRESRDAGGARRRSRGPLGACPGEVRDLEQREGSTVAAGDATGGPLGGQEPRVGGVARAVSGRRPRRSGGCRTVHPACTGDAGHCGAAGDTQPPRRSAPGRPDRELSRYGRASAPIRA